METENKKQEQPKPDEINNIQILSHIKIIDKKSGEILLNKRGRG